MTHARTIGLSAFFIVLTLVLASCGGGNGNIAKLVVSATQGGSLSSASGDLTLDFPAGAVTQDTVVRMEPVALADLPAEVEGAVGTAYKLGPAGLQFAKPVTVTTTLDPLEMEALGLDGGLISISEAGEQEVLAETETVAASDGSIVVTGSLTHLSWIVQRRGGVLAKLEQIDPVERDVWDLFQVQWQVENLESDYEEIGGEIFTSGPLEVEETVISRNSSPANPFGGTRVAVHYVETLEVFAILEARGAGRRYSRDATETLRCTDKGSATYNLKLRPRGRRIILTANVECVVPPTTAPPPPGSVTSPPAPGAPGLEAPPVLPPVLAVPGLRPSPPPPPPPGDQALLELKPSEGAPGVVISLVTEGFSQAFAVPEPKVIFVAPLGVVPAELVSATADLSGIKVRVPEELAENPLFSRQEEWTVFIQYGSGHSQATNSLAFKRLAIFIEGIGYTNALRVRESTDLTIRYSGTVEYPLRVMGSGKRLKVFEAEPANRELVVPQAVSCSRGNTVVELQVVLVDKRVLASKPVDVVVTCSP